MRQVLSKIRLNEGNLDDFQPIGWNPVSVNLLKGGICQQNGDGGNFSFPLQNPEQCLPPLLQRVMGTFKEETLPKIGPFSVLMMDAVCQQGSAI